MCVCSGPGAGKGTFCQRWADKYDWVHLSTGDLFRAEIASGSELGNQVKECIDNGQCVPGELPMKILLNAMGKAGLQKRFLIDGFPRTADNIASWEKYLSD